MCCFSFDAEVILANLFGSPKYNKTTSIELDFIESYCSYLDDIIPGYNIFYNSKADMEKAVNKYPMYYKCENDQIKIQSTPPLESFNSPYPPEISKKMRKAADVVWMAWALV